MEQHRTVGGGDVLHAASTARVTIDERGIVTEWSEGAGRLLGYPAEEVMGRSAAGLLAERVSTDRLRPMLKLPRWNGTLALRHRDGRELRVWILAHHRPEGGNRGAADWLLVSPLDDIRARPTDGALTQSGFAQSVSCTVALYDTGLRLRRANNYMERAMALTEDEMRGLRVSEIVVHPDSDNTERAMLRVLETGQAQYVENHVDVSGETTSRDWAVWLSALRNHDGEIDGVLLEGHDMTEQFQARNRLMLLNDASKCIGRTLDMTRTAEELAEVAVPALADFITVDLLASLDSSEQTASGVLPGSIRLRRLAHRSVLAGAPEAGIAPEDTGVWAAALPLTESLTSGEAAVHEVSDQAMAHWMLDDAGWATRLREFGMHSVMTVPMKARGMTLGVVTFVRHRRPAPFKEDDLLLAQEIAARAAICIDNARQYARERDTAVTLQRSLLPHDLPEQAAVDVASRYLPAGAMAGVGGDWFDVIQLSGARVALVVGDVVGHGVQASATMGRLRTAVRTLADVDLPPDELLTHLDDLVMQLGPLPGAWGWTEAPGEAFSGSPGAGAGELVATCLYAVYDPVSRRCTLARAGHPEPAVVTPDGTVKHLDVPAGAPLGLGGLPFEALETKLPEGSLLALYTDGLIESHDHDAEAGMRRLRDALARPASSLEGLCDHVLGTMLPGRRSIDDVALLIARTRALDASQVATWKVPADPAAVSRTRSDVAEQLEAWGLHDAVDVTELVVSELVTNAIRHARAPIELRLIHDRGLICEVSDASNTAPHLRRARSDDEGGRGLLLVSQLTQRWGTRQSTTGKTIWAEQTLPAA